MSNFKNAITPSISKLERGPKARNVGNWTGHFENLDIFRIVSF